MTYDEFEITPAPQMRLESGKWSLRVLITKHHDGRGITLEKIFIGKNEFDTQGEAEEHSVEFGKQIIDGKYPEFSLSDIL